MFDFNSNAFPQHIKTHANMVSGAITVSSTYDDLASEGDLYSVVRAASHFLSSPHFSGRSLTVIADAKTAPLHISADARGAWTTAKLYDAIYTQVHGDKPHDDMFAAAIDSGVTRLTLNDNSNTGADTFILALQAARHSEQLGAPVQLNIRGRDVTITGRTFPEEVEALFSLHEAMRAQHQPAKIQTPAR